MSAFRQAILAILSGVFSVALIFGSMLIALAEGGKLVALNPLPAATQVPAATPLPGQPTFTASPIVSLTPTPANEDIYCPQPAGWLAIQVLVGETLSSIAADYGVSLELLSQNNCDPGEELFPNSIIYIPPATATPTSTLTPTPTQPAPTSPPPTRRPTQSCAGPPGSWVIYIVRRGDTLSSLSRAFGTTVALLKSANCLTSDLIITGQRLYVPNVPTRTPIPTSTPRPSATLAPPPTEPTIIVPPTIAPSDTPPPTSDVPTAEPTYTPTATVVTPTNTPVTLTAVPPSILTPTLWPTPVFTSIATFAFPTP